MKQLLSIHAEICPLKWIHGRNSPLAIDTVEEQNLTKPFDLHTVRDRFAAIQNNELLFSHIRGQQTRSFTNDELNKEKFACVWSVKQVNESVEFVFIVSVVRDAYSNVRKNLQIKFLKIKFF